MKCFLVWYTLLSSFSVFSCSSEQRVCRRVECCFAGVLDNSNDETDTNNLHSDIVGDTKQAAGQWNQQQRTSGNTGSSDDGMGLTDYLLIVLVVLIVIMAIMVALRLMRS